MLDQWRKLSFDGLVFREDNRDADQEGKEDGCIIDWNIFLFTHHIPDHLGDHLQGEEQISKLDYFSCSF
jgi:hypothetical protein